LIDVVIASCDLSFDYHKLYVGFQALRRGAHFWATNTDATCPIGSGEVPDAGAVIGALEGCSRRKVELVAGKPSPLMADAVLARLALPAHQCLIVGDRLETDIVMGHQAGMHTALVLTGVTQREDLIHGSVQPDHVLQSIVEVPAMLTGQGHHS
jgi:HAD superfamily hydrolase (TIGR01450 family)